MSGEESVVSESEVAPVYYSLNGIRGDNPSAGIFIGVRGSQVKKSSYEYRIKFGLQ